ncbi:septum formation initiator family protein [Bdellovibrio bacteriovorus]|uniref:septum formation initiator family protein n=1 Tax=Bdellovibrio bacteriovorus TaxID=959 RepID=UPI0021CFDDCC|nr:septum formation initiator family protein [Bdellovibrio bacteriovorus]UXR64896.1 septum formation initiator family protein [Bdellovibrio bacteriovorus]
MFKKILPTTVLLLLIPLASVAQVSMWGTGIYGGMQSCSTGMKAGNGATSVDDTTKEIQAEIQEAQQQLKAKKSEKKKIDRTLTRTRQNIEKSIASDYADFIFEHMENSRRCEEYRGMQSENQDFTAEGQEGEATLPNASMIPVHGFTVSEWRQYCDQGKSGSVSGSVCTNIKFKETDGGRQDATTCKKGLTDYRKQHSQSEKLQREIEGLEDTIARAKEDLKDAKQDALEARREGLAQTEGDICIECMQQGSGGQSQRPQTDWANVIANVGTGLFASYMGYKQNQMVAEYNSNAGWPTQSYPALSYGYPYLMSGLYGAVSGATGQGTFGCGSTMGGTGNMNGPMGMTGAYGMGGMYGSAGGAFGYPAGMMGNNMGGGIYMGGMSPWGMNGGVPSYGYGMGNMMGYGSMMGNNMMSSMMGGLVGYGGLMGSYGSMMGSMMGTGNMMGYGIGYGSNMMGMGSMMGYDSSSLALQQQMMQMQLQQYQTAMQYQQQYQQQMVQKYQTVSSLQQELYSLMARIQQVQYGGTSYIGGTLGTGTSIYTGSYGSTLVPTPITNSTTTITPTVIPASR